MGFDTAKAKYAIRLFKESDNVLQDALNWLIENPNFELRKYDQYGLPKIAKKPKIESRLVQQETERSLWWQNKLKREALELELEKKQRNQEEKLLRKNLEQDRAIRKKNQGYHTEQLTDQQRRDREAEIMRQNRRNEILAQKRDRERVLQQIEEDRRRRLGLSNTTNPKPEQREPQPMNMPIPSQSHGLCLLQIRLPNGTIVRKEFNSNDTIATVYDYVGELLPSGIGFILFIPFPRREFDKNSLSLSVEEAGLAPRGTLTVLKNLERGLVRRSALTANEMDIELDEMTMDEIEELQKRVGNAESISERAKFALIENLPIRKTEDEDHSEMCLICQGEYELRETIKCLPCGHNYHDVCIDPWLRGHNTCPLCKYQIY
eukprot:TRINITY_DN4226_c1_g1_i4.p1 TRINITY_DN4226_c1_g1~~TRINITY_DN4226_c1_g1_i4.p1  ORF type:complete len:377 (-),score=73.78 TRINITY_DN4226_c1_g1_i4:898-2028(-)